MAGSLPMPSTRVTSRCSPEHWEITPTHGVESHPVHPREGPASALLAGLGPKSPPWSLSQHETIPVRTLRFRVRAQPCTACSPRVPEICDALKNRGQGQGQDEKLGIWIIDWAGIRGGIRTHQPRLGTCSTLEGFASGGNVPADQSECIGGLGDPCRGC